MTTWGLGWKFSWGRTELISILQNLVISMMVIASPAASSSRRGTASILLVSVAYLQG